MVESESPLNQVVAPYPCTNATLHSKNCKIPQITITNPNHNNLALHDSVENLVDYRVHFFLLAFIEAT